MSTGGKSTPYAGEQIGAAQSLIGQGQTLAGQGASAFSQGQDAFGVLSSGHLPPGAQASVDLATQDAINQVKARYGSLGQAGSTMEGDQIAYLQQRKAAMQFQIAQQISEEGLKAMGIGVSAEGAGVGATSAAGTIYGNLAKQQMQEDEQLTKAIAGFANVMGGAAAKYAFSGFGGGGGGGGGQQPQQQTAGLSLDDASAFATG